MDLSLCGMKSIVKCASLDKNRKVEERMRTLNTFDESKLFVTWMLHVEGA